MAGKKHKENVKETQTNPDHSLFEPQKQQLTLESAVQNLHNKNLAAEKFKKQLLKSQILFSHLIHAHGVPSSIFTCFSDTVAQIFPDSEIAKQWGTKEFGMRITKGDYFGVHGIAKFEQDELDDILRNQFFSIDFDESSISKLKLSELDNHPAG